MNLNPTETFLLFLILTVILFAKAEITDIKKEVVMIKTILITKEVMSQDLKKIQQNDK